jgi:hypothetical protein
MVAKGRSRRHKVCANKLGNGIAAAISSDRSPPNRLIILPRRQSTGCCIQIIQRQSRTPSIGTTVHRPQASVPSFPTISHCRHHHDRYHLRLSVERYESGFRIQHTTPRLSWHFCEDAEPDWVQTSYDVCIVRGGGGDGDREIAEYHIDSDGWPGEPLSQGRG